MATELLLSNNHHHAVIQIHLMEDEVAAEMHTEVAKDVHHIVETETAIMTDALLIVETVTEVATTEEIIVAKVVKIDLRKETMKGAISGNVMTKEVLKKIRREIPENLTETAVLVVPAKKDINILKSFIINNEENI